MNKKLLVVSALPVLALAILVAQPAAAHGMMGGGWGMMYSTDPDKTAQVQQNMFNQEATWLGVSVDDIKNAWAEGKSFAQLVKEKGISQTDLQNKMKQSRQDQLKLELQNLVDKGIITQNQADQRLKSIQDLSSKKGSSRFFGGMMRHWF